jgi:imidazolonepropionase
MKKILLCNASEVVTFVGSSPKKGAQMALPYIIKNGCVLCVGDKIQAVFSADEMDKYDLTSTHIIDCKGKTITAGFVDCHTHFVFGGYRDQEFNDRLNGVSYMEIMNRGGGIRATVEKTRAMTEQDLIKASLPRLSNYLEMGVTTIEGKSGYGLDIDTELKQHAVMDKLCEMQPIEIVQTFMGAHATPKEFDSAEKYIDFVINEVLPVISQKTNAEFCDVFCEKNVFDVNQSVRLLQAAKEHGLGIKMHAEEINPLGGSGKACEMGAVSVEHLLTIDDENIKRLAASNTVGVLLPATAFSLKEHYAPARKLIDSGAAVALATDLNPGSCYTQSIPLVIALSTMYMGMRIEEVLCALTLNAACAVNRGDKIGTLEKGKQADITVHNVPSLNFLSYNFCMNNVHMVIKKGEIVYTKSR